MILLIDNYDSFTYNLYHMLLSHRTEVRVVRHDSVSISDIVLLNPEAIILSPGPGHPKEAGICVELIRYFSGKIPILGVCLGHQAIVHAFGGDIISTGKLVHGKASLVYHDQEGIFSNMPMPFQAGRYHSLMADPDTLPDVLRVTAHSEPNIIMAVQHREHPTFGVQFHPESILTPGGDMLIAIFLTQYLQPIPQIQRRHQPFESI